MGGRGAAEVDSALDRFLKRLDRAIQPERVILFGSRARGDHLNRSDVDLLIVSRAFEGVGWRERLRRVLELWDGDVPLEPLCYTPEEFGRRSEEISIVRRAVEEGNVLVPS